MAFVADLPPKNKRILRAAFCGFSRLWAEGESLERPTWVANAGLRAGAAGGSLLLMDITLTGHFKSFIAEQLQGGRYRDASEVVRAALRELEQTELKRSLADFKAAFQKTDRFAPKGEPTPGDLEEIDRIITSQRAARRHKRAGQ